MRHRALDYEAGAPPHELGLAGLDDLLERGDLDDWAPIAREVGRDPRGEVATRLEKLLERRPAGPTTTLWKAFLEEKRRATAAAAIGPALRRARERSGLTQAEVARRLGATQPEVSKLERRSDARLSTVRDYVGALGGTLRLVATLGGEETELD
ncbi:helix-turn-helix domain-containing protein [Gaiella sp.]|jgi:DNA-binding XRE family transcriptional regulator|uniref:helix-turn-helix domain-containing protein n=1 Tax=Gaiella sp. TaxID=2663207 RepID=UPI002E33F433|nr:helix-turn-helix domain-containing protein [Gaiella sp.]HEX5585189.1 helix-turn-helix domain-containing protein [Gaiella sp.]